MTASPSCHSFRGWEEGAGKENRVKSAPKFVAAAVQCSSVFLDAAKTIEKIASLVKEASENGAELIAFPESIIPSYPYWVWLDSPFKWERRFSGRFFENCIEVGDRHTKLLCQIAKAHRAYLVIGMSEKSGGTIFNSQMFISEKGKLDGIHRKLIPTSAERCVWGRGDGSTLRTFETKFGRLGALICGEHHMPLTRYALLAEGEEIHIASFPGWPFKKAILPYMANIAVRNHAIEGQLFAINATSSLSNEMLDELCETERERAFFEEAGGGYSCIVSPYGSYLAGPLSGEEGIVYAEIDKRQIFSAKTYLDAAGHYARPDIFRLHVNRSEQKDVDYA